MNTVLKLPLVLATAAFCAIQPAYAHTKPAPQPVKKATPTTTPTSVDVTPESVRARILNGNTSVLTSLNNVYQAKATVNGARAKLLPSLSLGVGITPSFALSTISFLLPFLVPANWYNLDASKHQLTAEGYAFYITELDTYASALSLYMTVLGDIELRNVYQRQYENYSKIYEIANEGVKIGVETEVDLANAASQMELARLQVSQVDELLVQEKTSIRTMLGLPIGTTLNFTSYHFPALAEENTSPVAIYHDVHTSTPERNQIESLIVAAKDEKWAARWGFLSGTTLGVSTGSGDQSFGKLSVGTPMNLGFGIFPEVDLSSLNVDQLLIREQEIDLESSSAIESAWGSLVEARIQLEQGQLASANSDKVYQDALLSYQLGTTDLLHIIQAANTAASAEVGRVKAQVDVDNQRVSLNRVLISNQFEKVPTCNISIKSQGGGGIIGFFKRIFGGKKQIQTSVDALCKPGAASF